MCDRHTRYIFFLESWNRYVYRKSRRDFKPFIRKNISLQYFTSTTSVLNVVDLCNLSLICDYVIINDQWRSQEFYFL